MKPAIPTAYRDAHVMSNTDYNATGSECVATGEVQ